MEIGEKLICTKCKHYCLNGSGAEIGCTAFPDGIPNEIIESNNHNKPIKGQKNNLVFEEISILEEV